MSQRSPTDTKRRSSVSIANAVEGRVANPTDTWACGRDVVLLSPYDPERHASLVCKGALREGWRRAAPYRLTIVHGITNPEPAGMESSPRKTQVCILRGRGPMFYLDRWAVEHRAGLLLSKRSKPWNVDRCGDGFA